MKDNLSKKTSEFLERVYAVDRIKKAQEAQSRAAYIDEIAFIFSGAATEYFKCLINDRLPADLHSLDREHWEKEWRFHLGKRLEAQILRPIKVSNRQKAIQEAINDFTKIRCRSSLTTAANTMARYLHQNAKDLRKLLSHKDETAFKAKLLGKLGTSFLASPSDKLRRKVEATLKTRLWLP